MKKSIAILMMLAVFALSAPCALADGETVITTVIPTATYELVIPENQTITYGQTETLIGPVKVANSQNFSEGKYVTATVSYGPLETSGGEQIVYFLRSVRNDSSSSTYLNEKTIIFDNDGEGGVKEIGYVLDPSDGFRFVVDDLRVCISEESWKAAVPGSYSSTITFTSQIVTP